MRSNNLALFYILRSSLADERARARVLRDYFHSQLVFLIEFQFVRLRHANTNLQRGISKLRSKATEEGKNNKNDIKIELKNNKRNFLFVIKGGTFLTVTFKVTFSC